MAQRLRGLRAGPRNFEDVGVVADEAQRHARRALHVLRRHVQHARGLAGLWHVVVLRFVHFDHADAPGAVQDEIEASQAGVHGARLARARGVAGGAELHSRLALEAVAGLRQEPRHRLFPLLLALLPALRVVALDVGLEVVGLGEAGIAVFTGMWLLAEMHGAHVLLEIAGPAEELAALAAGVWFFAEMHGAHVLLEVVSPTEALVALRACVRLLAEMHGAHVPLEIGERAEGLVAVRACMRPRLARSLWHGCGNCLHYQSQQTPLAELCMLIW